MSLKSSLIPSPVSSVCALAIPFNLARLSISWRYGSFVPYLWNERLLIYGHIPGSSKPLSIYCQLVCVDTHSGYWHQVLGNPAACNRGITVLIIVATTEGVNWLPLPASLHMVT